MAVDYATAAGQLRLLVADVDETNPILTDQQVLGFLGLHGVASQSTDAPRHQVKRAAADALDVIATSEALVGKVMRQGDGTTTDGAKLADAIRKHAATLRVEADRDEQDATADDGDVLDVVEFRPYPRGRWS